MNLIEQLKRDEGVVLKVYKDSLGIRTAGVGHNLEAHGIDLPVGTPISPEQCDAWLTEDIFAACELVRNRLPWTDELDEPRRGVLQNMAFNMGEKLFSFRNTLAFVKSGDYEAASRHMLDSLWARQVGARARRLAAQMVTGVWQ